MNAILPQHKQDIIKDLQWILNCIQHHASQCVDLDQMHDLYSKGESVQLAIKLIKGELK